MRSTQLAMITTTLSLVVLPLCAEDADSGRVPNGDSETVEVFQFKTALETSRNRGGESKESSSAAKTRAPKLAITVEDGAITEMLPPVIIQPVANTEPRNLYAPAIELPPIEFPDLDLESPDLGVTETGPLDEPVENGFELELPPALYEAEVAQKSGQDGTTGPESNLAGPRPFIIPPSPECKEVGGAALTGDLASALFQPLSDVRLTGLSTEPPKTDEPDGALERPENAACEFFSDEFPAVYATEPCFAMASPYRTPYPFHHHPLYYEDANLERAGVSWGPLTTAKSIGIFGAQIAAWPFHAVIAHPREMVPALPDCPSLNRFGPLAVFNEAWRKHRNYSVRIVPRKIVPRPPHRTL